MNLTEYQLKAIRTQPSGTQLELLANFSMGLAGETGETVDYLKKVLFHGHELDHEHMKKELGDVLWYVANIADILGLDLGDIAALNIEKLMKRYPMGFSEEKSVNRND